MELLFVCAFFETVKAQTVPVVNLDPHYFGRWKLDPILKGNQPKNQKQKNVAWKMCVFFWGGGGGRVLVWCLMVFVGFTSVFSHEKIPPVTQRSSYPQMCGNFFEGSRWEPRHFGPKWSLEPHSVKRSSKNRFQGNKNQGNSPSNCWSKLIVYSTLLK